MKTGVECEFFLLQPDGTAISDAADTASKPCYDQQALMRRYDVITEICDYMLELGWAPYQNDHEDANGQFEMNWDFDDALVTADRHAFFKFMVKSIAEKHGLRATFMPKPFLNLTGNGCHAHVSLWQGRQERLRRRQGRARPVAQGYNFLGGIMNAASELCAITNPTVNSYKRINAPRTLSGATWSPNTVTCAGNNRTHMVRVPGGGRFELRLPTARPIPICCRRRSSPPASTASREADPGKPLDIDMYAEGHKVPAGQKLPLNLLDALRLTERSELLRRELGDEFVNSYVKLKNREWNDYCAPPHRVGARQHARLLSSIVWHYSPRAVCDTRLNR